MKRVMIAGTGSGCGKTTVTCAVLGALKNRGTALCSFKCGPDFIDPMFHTKVLGVSCRNLDSFLCPEQTVKYLFAKAVSSHTTAVLEGVMGYYDGLSGTKLAASSHHIARLLDTPVVLVLGVKGKSLSLAAELQGFLGFEPNRIRGVIFNGAAEHTYPMYKEIAERHTGVRVLGYLPQLPGARLESRHLGLVGAQEIHGLREKMELLALQAERTVDLDGLLELARGAGELEYLPAPPGRLPDTPRIAVAMDGAFSFYYQDSLDLLKLLGARLIPFSPMADPELPAGVGGLLLGGGYPELYARLLSNNRPMLSSIAAAVGDGMPTIAECGGFMLLCREFIAGDGERYPLAGVLDTDVRMAASPGPFGYVTLRAKEDNLLCERGRTLRAHEFHYSRAENPGAAFVIGKDSGRSWEGVYATDTLYAGYPHLYLWGAPEAARRFAQKCLEYQQRGRGL